jgi:hypothetical protein
LERVEWITEDEYQVAQGKKVEVTFKIESTNGKKWLWALPGSKVSEDPKKLKLISLLQVNWPNEAASPNIDMSKTRNIRTIYYNDIRRRPDPHTGPIVEIPDQTKIFDELDRPIPLQDIKNDIKDHIKQGSWIAFTGELNKKEKPLTWIAHQIILAQNKPVEYEIALLVRPNLTPRSPYGPDGNGYVSLFTSWFFPEKGPEDKVMYFLNLSRYLIDPDGRRDPDNEPDVRVKNIYMKYPNDPLFYMLEPHTQGQDFKL